jgi:hypothetical protein
LEQEEGRWRVVWGDKAEKAKRPLTIVFNHITSNEKAQQLLMWIHRQL